MLKQRELSEAVDILKSFEKKETNVATAAATNLSFMFFLQGDIEQAEKYGVQATKADYYNSSAYVNLGNCHFARQEYDEAKRCYSEAVHTDSACTEALYNLGIVNQQLQFFEDALECFHKVQALVRNHPHVTYMLGRTHELMSESEIAMEWYLKALVLTPTDPGILKKLGRLCDYEGDRQQAYQHFVDCYKYDPSDLEVIEWLAQYLQEMQLPERAINFYQKALALQPEDTRWQLAMGACYRRTGNYAQAIECYYKVYRENPEHIPALQALARLSSDMGLKEAENFAEELKKLERASEARMSAGGRHSGRFGPPSRMGSTRASHSRGRSGEMDHRNDNGYAARSFESSRAETESILEDDFVPDLDIPGSSARSRSRMQSPMQTGRKLIEQEDEDEDIFGDEHVTEDLLPL